MQKQSYEIHEAANIFPMMSADEFDGLKADIAEHGIRSPITFWRDMLLDGRNRMRACEELGIDPPCEELDESYDPWEYVISHNLHRRHLTVNQRSMIAAKMETLKRGDVQSQRGVSQDTPSIEDVAKQLNVGRASVARAKQVLAHGSKEVIDAVERGELPISLAAKFVTEESDKKTQTKLVKQGRDAVKQHITSNDYVDEPSPVPSEKEEKADDNVQEFKRFWIKFSRKCSPLGRQAVRIWFDENFLNQF
jgi:ParB-like chromosome segregation protein Spo0J